MEITKEAGMNQVMDVVKTSDGENKKNYNEM